MMDDRDLLERAARAAGYDLSPHKNFNRTPSLMFTYKGKNWNPLENDGDAFRLMIDAELVVAVAYGEIMATHDEVTAISGPLGDDPHATARRAIVRAAAKKVSP